MLSLLQFSIGILLLLGSSAESFAKKLQVYCPPEVISSSLQKQAAATKPNLAQRPRVKVLLIPIQYGSDSLDSKSMPRNWEPVLRNFEAYLHQVSKGKHIVTAELIGHVLDGDTIPFCYPAEATTVRANVYDYFPKIGPVHAEVLRMIEVEYGNIYQDVVCVFFLHLGNVFDGYTGYGNIGDISSYPGYTGAGSGIVDFEKPDMNLWNILHEYGHLLDLWHPPNNGAGRFYGVYNLMENVYEDDNIEDNSTPYHPLDLIRLGWTDTLVTLQKSTQAVEVPSFSTSGKLIKIMLNAANDEYYLIGNYQGENVFKRYRGHGLLIWHIKATSILDLEMPTGLFSNGKANPVSGKDLLDSLGGTSGGQECFWTPELRRDLTPFTNPNTSLYTSFSRFDPQVRSSGVSITSMRYKENDSSVIVFDLEMGTYPVRELTNDINSFVVFKKSAANGEVLFQSQSKQPEQVIRISRSYDNKLFVDINASNQEISENFSAKGRWMMGDFKGDGSLRILTISSGSANSYRWSGRDWTRDIPFSWSDAAENTEALNYIDVDGDGHSDLVRFLKGTGSEWQLEVDSIGAVGSHTRKIPLENLESSERFEWNDINSDGKPDLISTKNILLNQGERFTSIMESSGIQAVLGTETLAKISVGDLNADGKSDLLMAGANGSIFLFMNLDGTHFTDISRLYYPYPKLRKNTLDIQWKSSNELQQALVKGTDGLGASRVYEFKSFTQNRFAVLELNPPASNPLAIGTQIKVFGDSGLFWSSELHTGNIEKTDLSNIYIPVPSGKENSLVLTMSNGDALHYANIEKGKKITAFARTTRALAKSQNLGETRIEFDRSLKRLSLFVSHAGTAHVLLYQMDGALLGRESRLVAEAGSFVLDLNGTNHLKPKTNGVYLVRLTIGRDTVVRRIVY